MSWPTDAPVPTNNLDSDSDTVTGGSGAREDLRYAVTLLNKILAAVPGNATLWHTANDDEIAFLSGLNNTFTRDIAISNSVSPGSNVRLRIETDSTQTNVHHGIYVYGQAGAGIGGYTVTENIDGKVWLRATTGTNYSSGKLRISETASALVCDDADIKYGNVSLLPSSQAMSVMMTAQPASTVGAASVSSSELILANKHGVRQVELVQESSEALGMSTSQTAAYPKYKIEFDQPYPNLDYHVHGYAFSVDKQPVPVVVVEENYHDCVVEVQIESSQIKTLKVQIQAFG